MIYPAKYNGINFSYDFTRESNKYNFDNQRIKQIIPSDSFGALSFFVNDEVEPEVKKLTIYGGDTETEIIPHSTTALNSGYIIFFNINSTDLTYFRDVYMSFRTEYEIIYSEICEVKHPEYLVENEICKIFAWNNNSKHGYATEALPAFGFFKFSKLKSDIFLNKKTEYEYSYGRKEILSSENQIAKRFTFLDLTMYQANLLKWLCNCENLYIDGINYQLASDFTEISSDENSEIMDLRADFIEVNQSFFSLPSITAPKNIFTNNFFMK